MGLGIGALGMRLHARGTAPSLAPTDLHAPASHAPHAGTEHPLTETQRGDDEYDPEAPDADLNALVAGFRGTTSWRDPQQLAMFMETMTNAIARSPEQSAVNLKQLLRGWNWRFGETITAEDGEAVSVGVLLEGSIALPVATQSGGPAMADANLRVLVETLSQEPDHIPAGIAATGRLGEHAGWVAHALRRVVTLTAADRAGTARPIRQASEETQLQRVLRMVLETLPGDARWVSLVVQRLAEIGPVPELGLHLTHARWVRAISDELKRHVESTRKDSAASKAEH